MVRVHGTTRRRPIDLFEESERAALRPLPSEPYEIAIFARHKVRKDCHVQVRSNYYSVPHTLVGEHVSVRTLELRIDIFAAGECVASHERSLGTGKNITDTRHYPPTKRIGSQEIHRRRVEHVRSAGPHTQGYLARLREGPWVFGDQIARLDRLASSFGLAALEKACARAQHFGALDGATRVEKILERGLHELALDAHHASTSRVEHDFGRKLAEYDALLVERKVAS
jgi:hypothetical protein